MKKLYEHPYVKTSEFSKEDVLTASTYDTWTDNQGDFGQDDPYDFND